MCCVLWSHWVLPFPWVNFPAESRCALPKQSLLLTLTQVLLSGGFHLFYLRLSFHQRLVALQKLELVCVQVKLFQGTMVFTQTKCCEYTCPDNECKLYIGCSLKCLRILCCAVSSSTWTNWGWWQLISAIHMLKRRQEQCAWKRKHGLRSHHSSPPPHDLSPSWLPAFSMQASPW